MKPGPATTERIGPPSPASGVCASVQVDVSHRVECVECDVSRPASGVCDSVQVDVSRRVECVECDVSSRVECVKCVGAVVAPVECGMAVLLGGEGVEFNTMEQCCVLVPPTATHEGTHSHPAPLARRRRAQHRRRRPKGHRQRAARLVRAVETPSTGAVACGENLTLAPVTLEPAMTLEPLVPPHAAQPARIAHPAPAAPVAPPVAPEHAPDLTHTLVRVLGRVYGTDVSIMIDCGSSHDFMARRFARRLDIESDVAGTMDLRFGDGHTVTQPMRRTEPVVLTMDGWVEERRFHLLAQASHDIILGKPWLSQWNPVIDWTRNIVQLLHPATGVAVQLEGLEGATEASFHFITGRQATKAIRAGERSFLVWLQQAEGTEHGGAHVACTDPRQRGALSALLRRFDDCLPDSVTELPPKRHIEHSIDIVPGAHPPHRKPFRLSQPELLELKDVLAKLLAKGFIRPSVSPYGAPVFFVRKADGGFRFICDWRELNRITIKNKACIPNVEDLFDRVQGARFFSHMDLHLGYNQVLVKESDVHKTAIATPFGHFEWLVMGLGMTNAPATFQTMMTDIFRPFLFDFVVVFLDDILVFSNTLDEHLRHLESVFEVLRQHKLYAKPPKCTFGASEVKFLGHIISGDTIRADPAKLECVAAWAQPTGVREVRTFLGFANYFRRFIADFASVAAPLESLLRQGVRFSWGDQHQAAFDGLRTRLLSAPVLRLPDGRRPYRVETDASDTRVAAVLLQQHEGQWHPVAFLSRRLTGAEQRYTTSEREMLAAVWALGVWRLYLFQHFDIVTDNRTLAHLQSKPHLTKREANWVDFLAEFDFTIVHRRGSDNGAADALSRASTTMDEATTGDEAATVATLSSVESLASVGEEVLAAIKSGYARDEFFTRVLQDLSGATPTSATQSCFTLRDGLLLRAHDDGAVRVCVPEGGGLRVKLLQQFHDCVTAGHPGRERTYSRLQRTCFWPGMYTDIRKFVRSCDVCQRTKPRNQPAANVLQPLPVPQQRWESVALDLITDLPRTTSGVDAIVTFTDRLSKRVHLAATTKTVTAAGMARLFIDRVFVLHGIPRVLVSDRDPRFTSDLWGEVFRLLDTRLSMSTANHPQTDGQSESTNKTVEQVLRAFANYRMDNWDSVLALAEFAINDSKQSSTGVSPFFADVGQHPLTPATLLVPTTTAPATTTSAEGDGAAFVRHQAQVLGEVRDALVVAQQRQMAAANGSRVHRAFAVGDLVLVATDYLMSPEQRLRPHNKLLPTWQGPWPVVEVVSPSAYRLQLPQGLRAHPVVSVEALRGYVINDMPDRVVLPPPPVPSFDDPEVDEEVVESILDAQRRGKTWWYLVKWAGKPLHLATWEPEANFIDSDGVVTDALLLFRQQRGRV